MRFEEVKAATEIGSTSGGQCPAGGASRQRGPRVR